MNRLPASLSLTVAALAACVSPSPTVTDPVAAEPTSAVSKSPSESPLPSPSPTRRKLTVEKIVRSPDATVTCPEDFTFPWGEGARVDFNVTIDPGTSTISFWEMEYGDGGSYSADSQEAAFRDVFWHVYESPGVYTPTVRVTGIDGGKGSDSCTFEFSWTEPPPPPPAEPSTRVEPPAGGWTGGGGSGTGSGDGWLGCHYNGIPMWGDVQIVDHFPDITVKVVDHFPDLKVKEVQHFPDSCGEWKVVDHFPDFTVKFVDHFPDITVELVDHFPGR